jgi:hypothetical protein
LGWTSARSWINLENLQNFNSMVNSPNVVNKHQNTFIREMLFQGFYAECMMRNIRIASLCNGQVGKFSWIWIEPKSGWLSSWSTWSNGWAFLDLLCTKVPPKQGQQRKFLESRSLYLLWKYATAHLISTKKCNSSVKGWKWREVIFLTPQASSTDIFGHVHTAWFNPGIIKAYNEKLSLARGQCDRTYEYQRQMF